MKKHLTHHKGFTARAKDWQLVHKESYVTKALAYQRELTIKRWKSRKKIETLIGK